jgi:hypothetical protein
MITIIIILKNTLEYIQLFLYNIIQYTSHVMHAVT